MTAPSRRRLSALFALIVAITLLSSGCADAAQTARPGRLSDTPAQDTLNGPDRPPSQQVVVVGDQYATGTMYGGLGPTNWTHDLQRLIGRAGIDAYVRNFARIGTGYTPNTAVSTTFSDDIRRGVNEDTDVVIVFGGGNDMEAVPVLRDAVSRTLDEVTAVAPKAKTIVVGPLWSGKQELPPQLLAANDAIKESCERAGVQFINPIADNWFTGRDDLRADDGSPNDAAQPVIAERLSGAVIAALRSGRAEATPAPTTATTTTAETTETETETAQDGEPETSTPETTEAIPTSTEAPHAPAGPPPGPAALGPPPGPQSPAGPPPGPAALGPPPGPQSPAGPPPGPAPVGPPPAPQVPAGPPPGPAA